MTDDHPRMPPSAFLCLPACQSRKSGFGIWATCIRPRPRPRPRQPRQSPVDSVPPDSYRFTLVSPQYITYYRLLSSHRTRTVTEQTHHLPMLGKLSQGPSAPPDPVALAHYRAAYSARHGPHSSTAFYFSLGVQRPPPPILSSSVPSLPSAACPDGGSSPADAFPI